MSIILILYKFRRKSGTVSEIHKYAPDLVIFVEQSIASTKLINEFVPSNGYELFLLFYGIDRWKHFPMFMICPGNHTMIDK